MAASKETIPSDSAKLDAMAKDIEFLKAAVNKGNPILNHLLDSMWYHSIGALVLGIMFLSVSFAFQFAVFAYQGEANLPDWIKLAGIGGMTIVLLSVSVWKLTMFATETKKFGRNVSIMEVFGSFFSGASFHVHVPIAVTMVAGSAFLLSRGLGWYILPLICAYSAVVFNLYAGQMGNARIRLLGYWMLLAGLISLPIVDFAPYFCFGLVFGTIMIAFFAIALVYGLPERPGNGR